MLRDEDGYEYETYEISGLPTKFKRKNIVQRKLHWDRLYGYASLRPKILVKGTLIFQIPIEECNFYLTMKNGTIEEV